MKFINDLHFQFTELVPDVKLKPFAYLLSKRLSEGNVCIDLVKEDLNKEYDSWSEEIREVIPRFSEGTLKEATNILSVNPEDRKPFIVFNGKFYSYRYFNYETQILDKINSFISNEKAELLRRKEALKVYSEQIFALQDEDLDITDWQLAGCLNSYLNNFSIITGGPGTGKTTTIAKLLVLLYTINPSLKVAIAAPTGKAAIRMLESLKNNPLSEQEPLKSKIEELEGTTIHRLLGYKMGSHYFKKNENNYLDFDVVIVDEASMIDVPLFAKLLGAIDPSKRVVLLGDKNQLASVEAGSLFGDLCQAQEELNHFSKERIDFINSFITQSQQQLHESSVLDSSHPLFEHIIELQKSHRFSDDKGIGKFSKAIIQNNENVLKEFFKNEDEQVIIDEYYSDKIFHEFVEGYSSFILEKDILIALKKLNNLKVLCAVREGEKGLYAINNKIQTFLVKKNLIKLTGDFYENRPIMVNSNDYELGLFNGDVGIVRPDANNELKVWFEIKGEAKSFIPASISNAETVLAMTIHKSQGSEFEKVMVILPQKEDSKILTRELLYTAVTRAKSSVIIQASHELILQTSGESVKRGSGIIQRFV